MPLNSNEFRRYLSIKGENRRTLFLALQMRPQWWATVPELAAFCNIAPETVRRDLAVLAHAREVEHKPGDAGGNGKKGLFRYQPTDPRRSVTDPPRSVGSDPPRSVTDPRRSVSDPQGSVDTSYTHARGHAPPAVSGSESDTSVRLEGSGEAHTRPADVQDGADGRESDVQWIGKLWAVAGAIAYTMRERLAAYGFTRGEIRKFLTEAKFASEHDMPPAHVFHRLRKADLPLGAACSEERAPIWLAQHRAKLETRAAELELERAREGAAPATFDPNFDPVAAKREAEARLEREAQERRAARLARTSELAPAPQAEIELAIRKMSDGAPTRVVVQTGRNRK